MNRYVYAFNLSVEDGEVFFRFPRMPEIVSAVSQEAFAKMSPGEIEGHAHDAVITALRGYVVMREHLPETDDPRLVQAGGFAELSPSEAMKLELFTIYRANCRSIADFARRIGKAETVAYRLLDLRHRSRTHEVEAALERFNKKLVHCWDIVPLPADRAGKAMLALG